MNNTLTPQSTLPDSPSKLKALIDLVKAALTTCLEPMKPFLTLVLNTLTELGKLVFLNMPTINQFRVDTANWNAFQENLQSKVKETVSDSVRSAMEKCMNLDLLPGSDGNPMTKMESGTFLEMKECIQTQVTIDPKIDAKMDPVSVSFNEAKLEWQKGVLKGACNTFAISVLIDAVRLYFVWDAITTSEKNLVEFSGKEESLSDSLKVLSVDSLKFVKTCNTFQDRLIDSKLKSEDFNVMYEYLLSQHEGITLSA